MACVSKCPMSSLYFKKLITALNCLLNRFGCGAARSLKPNSLYPQILISLESRLKNFTSGRASL